jgi:PKHD-type hydroxylase
MNYDIAWRLRSEEALYKSFSIKNVFTDKEIALIKEQALELPAEQPRIRETSEKDAEIRTDNKVRVCQIKWMLPAENTQWIYRKLVDAVQKINSDIFNLNLYGLQPLQYTIYNDAEQGFYGPHRDVLSISFGAMTRKLSFSLQLTDPSEYEGGDLVFDVAFKPYDAPKELGTLTFFLSDVLHEAKPVTKGSRHVLVGWVVGPPLA